MCSDHIFYCRPKSIIFQHSTTSTFQHEHNGLLKYVKITWYFKLKMDQKVLWFNYCLKNYSGSFLTKKDG